jgi:hypothetical protein
MSPPGDVLHGIEPQALASGGDDEPAATPAVSAPSAKEFLDARRSAPERPLATVGVLDTNRAKMSHSQRPSRLHMCRFTEPVADHNPHVGSGPAYGT